MSDQNSILITGACGFIGSALVWQLNKLGVKNILVCDWFRKDDKWKNLRSLEFDGFTHPDKLFDFVAEKKITFKTIYHMGACSSTTEKDMDFLYNNNTYFSQKLWDLALEQNARYIYASSAATYGEGENGFDDNEEHISRLSPLNPYGYSKQLFDLWVLKQKEKPIFAGLKFFNVFGPNEYHKGMMSSVVFHAFNQIKNTGKVKLFKSHIPTCEDGKQKRDFVYIKDVTEMLHFFKDSPFESGIYNVGQGKAHTFLDLIHAIFKALGQKPRIQFIDMPISIRQKYQYFTQANMEKLQHQGYKKSATPLEESVHDYVVNYLGNENPYLRVKS